MNALEHRVLLTAEMMALLNALPKHETSKLVFHSSKGNPLSEERLKTLAEAQGLSLSKFVRDACADAVKRADQ